MRVPYSWGRPTGMPGVFALGDRDWTITWSPMQIHPYTAQWLTWSRRFGPGPECQPPQDLWSYGLQTKPIS